MSEVVDEAAGKVTNELRLVQLRRTDLHSILTCQASNNNISVPASTSVKLDMHCKFLLDECVCIKKKLYLRQSSFVDLSNDASETFFFTTDLCS